MTGGTMNALTLIAVLVASVSLGGCSRFCTPTSASALPTVFSGSVPGGGTVFHDLVVASGTDSVDVRVQWTTAEAELEIFQIDANCDPSQHASCQRLYDSTGPAPGSPQVIAGLAFHQGASATGRVRVVVRNLTPSVATSYTMTLTPKRHGTDC
jgi:hypothetical protein